MSDPEIINVQSTQIALGKKARYISNNSVKFTLYPNCQEECQIEQLFCVNQSVLSKILEIMFYVFTGGIGLLILFWIPSWRFKMFFKIVDVEQSNGVTVFGPDDDLQMIPYVKSKNIPSDQRIFQYRFQRYIYKENKFVPYFENSFEMKNSELVNFPENNKVDSSRIATSIQKNGSNCTNVPDKGLFVMCMIELLTPFYFFQIGSCILWYYELYIYYPYVILITAFIGFVFKMFEERTNFLRLKKFSYQRYLVRVERNGEEKQIMNNEVIFGDIMRMKQGEIVCCDLIVIQGSAIVNESMLTGESIPIVKTPLPNNNELFYENKQSIIYSGSVILQTSNLKCIAFRLGFETLRGNLIRSIMYPKKHSQISFSADSLYFILIMGLAALISFFVSLPTFLDKLDQELMEKVDVIIRCCDLITISVPPALPTCLSFGISFSMRRLAKNQIYCINSQKINICGIVRTICFDKTGTLTESLLSYKMVSAFEKENFTENVNSSSLNKMQRVILGGCHSLQLFNGTIAGDPLDQEMFAQSGWTISEKNEEQLMSEGNGVKKEIHSADLKEKIEILEIHQFESEYERMSTVIRYEGQLYVLCKGSPEKLKTICRPETLPQSGGMNGYTAKLNSFTKLGYRVISLCYKKIESDSIHKNRQEQEQNLIFAGFLVFENKLKPETIPNIKILKDSKIQVHMVTGDNPQTSLNIAKQCNIINSVSNAPILDYQNHQITIEIDGVVNNLDNINSLIVDTSAEFVITGNFFQKFFVDDHREANTKNLCILLFLVKVYARMKPNQKQQLIRLLQIYSNTRGYTFIGMCGDGANDCQALKDADMGISLGDTEASIAASFTSKIMNISVIEYALREGRCCLTTSFQCFKFMALYSMIQVSTTAILYQRGIVPSDFQFLYWDLFIIFPLAFLLGLTEASNKLSVEQPTHRLFSAQNIVSVGGLGLIQLGFQIIIIAMTASQSWYMDPISYEKVCEIDEEEILMNSFDNSVLFWVSNFQYLFCLITFSVGSVHKKAFWSNKYFSGYLLAIVALSFYLLFTTDGDVNDFFQILPDLANFQDGTVYATMTYNWRFAVLGIIIANTIITVFYEIYVARVIVKFIERKFPNLIYSGISSIVSKQNAKTVPIEDNHSLKINQSEGQPINQ